MRELHYIEADLDDWSDWIDAIDWDVFPRPAVES